MIFWDTSALVPLLVDEPRSDDARELLQRDPELIVWWGSEVECLSALARREREEILTPDDTDTCRQLLARLRRAWSEVLPTAVVREQAALLLRRHPLRAADALQLGAALTWARGRPDGHAFAALDDRLCRAARAEGLALPLRPR